MRILKLYVKRAPDTVVSHRYILFGTSLYSPLSYPQYKINKYIRLEIEESLSGESTMVNRLS